MSSVQFNSVSQWCPTLQTHELQHARLPCDSDCKESACNGGDLGLIPGLGRSAGGGDGNPLQFSCLGNPMMDRGAWQATVLFSSVQLSRSVVSNSLWPHQSHHARPPCPSQTPGVHSDSHPSSQWCHPAISSSVIPFSSCPQYLPASESFPMNQFFAWGGQSIGVSALASVLPKNTQDWSPLEWTDNECL